MAVQFLLFAHAASSVLVYQDVNILAVTDVHAWIAGGDRQTSEYDPPITHTSLDATFGDLISFAARTKAGSTTQHQSTNTGASAQSATGNTCSQIPVTPMVDPR